MASNINAEEADKLLKNNEAILIDVRDPEEFKAEHIAYALSIPLNTLDKNFKALNIPVSKIIIFQCLKGSRGKIACDKIQKLGTYQNKLANIEGGIHSWKEKGLPIITSDNTRTKMSVFRQVQIIIGVVIFSCIIFGFAGLTIAFILAGALSAALFLAGITGWCGLAILLNKMPWNK